MMLLLGALIGLHSTYGGWVSARQRKWKAAAGLFVLSLAAVALPVSLMLVS